MLYEQEINRHVYYLH